MSLRFGGVRLPLRTPLAAAIAMALACALAAQPQPSAEKLPINAPQTLTARSGKASAQARILESKGPQIRFSDRTGRPVEGSASFSHPRPVVRLKDLRRSDIRVADEVATFTLSGSVTDALADIVEGGRGDIREVIVEYRDRTSSGWPMKSERVKVTRSEAGRATKLRPFPFRGAFLTTIRVPLFPGSTFVSVGATNLIGNSGYDSVSLLTDVEEGVPTAVSSGAPPYEIARFASNGFGASDARGALPLPRSALAPRSASPGEPGEPGELKVREVLNHGSTRPGFANPILIEIVGAPDGVDSIAFGGRKLRLVRKEGRVLADRPLIAVARDIPSDAPNLLRADTLKAPVVFTVGSAEEQLSFSYTAQSPPNYFKYAEGTTVFHTIWDPSFREGGIQSVSFLREGRNGQWVEDNSLISVDPKEMRIVLPESPVPGLVLKLKISPGAAAVARSWQCIVRRNAVGKPRLVANFDCGPFEVVRLKTVIVGVDGLAYDAYKGAIADGAKNFKRVFEDGADAGKRVISALPTITWCNWPGIFSASPPRAHGVLGNSFFERDRLGVQPINSASRWGPDSYDQFWVTVGDLDNRAKDDAGSIYDLIIGPRPGREWRVVSLYHFYSRSRLAKVQRWYYPWAHGHKPWTLLGHSADAARGMDEMSGHDSGWYFGANMDDLDILSVYFPGPDNFAHAVGASAGGPDLPEVSKPLAAIGQHFAKFTDPQFGTLVDQIESGGYLSATLFALTADHGLHAYFNDPFVVTVPGGLGELFKRYAGLKAWASPGVDWAEADVVYGPNGGMGQVYLKGRTWRSTPSRERIQAVARALFIEATAQGQGPKYPYLKACPVLAPKRNPAYRGAVDRGALGSPPAIFVRYWDEAKGEDNPNHMLADEGFRWVKGIDPETGEPQLGSIDDFQRAREGPSSRENACGTEWPDFAARIQEMNEQSLLGSRTGDILIFTDGAAGYLTVNDSQGDRLPGWHGGASQAESYVPLVFNVPGAFANRGALKSVLPEKGCLRNWMLGTYIQKARQALGN